MAAVDGSKSSASSERVAASGRQRERLLLWVLLFLGFRTVAPLGGVLPRLLAVPGALLTTMLLALWGPRLFAALAIDRRWQLPFFGGFAAISLVFAAAVPGSFTPATGRLLAAASDLTLILAAVALGQFLASLFREPNLLVPAAVAAAVIDFWGVYFGTTREIIERHGEWVPKLTVQVPVPSAPGFPELHLGIGFGDFVFLTLFLVCARRFGLREARTFWLSFVLLIAAMGLVLVLDQNVPALVPMAAAFLLANAGRFRFQRSEVFAMVYAAALTGVVAGLIWMLGHG